VVHLREKPYSPHFFKPTLGFSSEVDGVTQLTMGVGYRRPWLTPSGLELLLDGRIGTQSELAVRLAQPLSPSWRVESGLSWDLNHLPIYKTVLDRDDLSSQKLAYLKQSLLKWDAQLVYDFQRKANVKLGLTSGRIKRTSETVSELLDSTGSSFSDFSYNGLRAQVQIDQLDSVSFPTQGYFLSASLEQGISGTRYGTGRVSAKVAHSIGPKVQWHASMVKDSATAFKGTPYSTFGDAIGLRAPRGGCGAVHPTQVASGTDQLWGVVAVEALDIPFWSGEAL
jgi:NTE family protein